MPKTYKEMLNALLDMKESGRFNKEHIDEILDAIADGVDYGVDVLFVEPSRLFHVE